MVESSASAHAESSAPVSSVSRFLSSALSPAYGPAVYLARQACLSLLVKLNQPDAKGLLQIHDADADGQPAETLVFGNPMNKRALRQRTDKVVSKVASQWSTCTSATIVVRDRLFWIRLALGNDLGFAESYMLGEIDTPDLGDCFKIFIENRAILSNFNVGIVSKVSSFLQGFVNRRYANTKAGSSRNIPAHYCISNRMFEAFLSRDMTYSCAVFPTLDADVTGPLLESVQSQLKAEAVGAAKRDEDAKPATNGHSHRGARSAAQSNGSGAGRERGAMQGLHYDRLAASQAAARDMDPSISPAANGHNGTSNVPDGVLTPGSSHTRTPLALSDDELEDGQLRKLQIHIDRAALAPHHRVLEIGTGWGSLSIEAVRSSGCHVDSLTLSVEQKALAEQRIADAGLSDRIKVHLMDYRDMPAEWTDHFDRVISIEMLEAVGIEFLATYFQHVHRVLKCDGGVCVVQCITMPEERFAAYVDTVDFIKKWIFPGGVLPSVTSLINAATDGSDGTLILDTVHSIGPHYSRTLREWRYRFEKHFDATIAPALVEDHVEIRSLPAAEQRRQVEVFRRKWLYYFIYCEVGFTERVIGDHILSFTRSGNKTLPVCCA